MPPCRMLPLAGIGLLHKRWQRSRAMSVVRVVLSLVDRLDGMHGWTRLTPVWIMARAAIWRAICSHRGRCQSTK